MKLTQGECLKDGVQSVDVLALAKRKDVVLAKTAALNGETIAESTQIPVQFHRLLFWDSQKNIFPIGHYGEASGSHTVLKATFLPISRGSDRVVAKCLTISESERPLQGARCGLRLPSVTIYGTGRGTKCQIPNIPNPQIPKNPKLQIPSPQFAQAELNLDSGTVKLCHCLNLGFIDTPLAGW
jgi:hypothetical protein